MDQQAELCNPLSSPLRLIFKTHFCLLTADCVMSHPLKASQQTLPVCTNPRHGPRTMLALALAPSPERRVPCQRGRCRHALDFRGAHEAGGRPLGCIQSRDDFLSLIKTKTHEKNCKESSVCASSLTRVTLTWPPSRGADDIINLTAWLISVRFTDVSP